MSEIESLRAKVAELEARVAKLEEPRMVTIKMPSEEERQEHRRKIAEICRSLTWLDDLKEGVEVDASLYAREMGIKTG